jgi:prephenate dehydrogenase
VSSDAASFIGRANVLGLGLIGGSLALALQRAGYEVGGIDSDVSRTELAVQRSIIHQAGLFADAEVTFVATPVNTVAEQVALALEQTSGVVTDVGSVKSHVAHAIFSLSLCRWASDGRFRDGRTRWSRCIDV